jgi:hypothetical protein
MDTAARRVRSLTSTASDPSRQGMSTNAAISRGFIAASLASANVGHIAVSFGLDISTSRAVPGKPDSTSRPISLAGILTNLPIRVEETTRRSSNHLRTQARVMPRASANSLTVSHSLCSLNIAS